MSPADVLNWKAAHSHLLAAQHYLLEHMAQRPEAYSAAPEGLCAYREIAAAAGVAWSIIEGLAIRGVAVNG